MEDKKIKGSKKFKKLRREEIWEKISDLSSGVLATGIDLVLFFIFQGINLGEYGYGSIAARRATESSIDDVLACGIDKETIKKAIWKATHRKLIKRPKRDERLFEITREGIERLKSLFPEYQSKRAWDSHFYLVTYDIPEKRHRDRDLLREYLRKIGCGMLQASVWLTPYNPQQILKKFIEENNLPGTIIVSDIGKDGSVGDEDLDDLVSRVYHLGEINGRYENFIGELREGTLNKVRAHFYFLSILKDDPQLPFEILPYNWLGDKAYKLVKETNLS